MIDSTVIRAHHLAAGQKGNSETRFWPFKSGFMTRFHLIANAHGLPIRAELSGGEVSNFKGFDALVDDDLPEVSDVSAYGTNQRDYLREDFWLIVVTVIHAH